VLGLTATASPAVREEIVEWLGLRDPEIVARGFDRPNLSLAVEMHHDAAAKRRALVEWVRDVDPPGIVYAATRRATTEVAEAVAASGRSVAAYHAGLGARRRDEVQDGFMAGRVEVIVATIAFGMGIDKPDVRFVAHHDPSDGLDAYHQEIGRAGRDGEPAAIRLFYRPDDLGLRRFQVAPAVVEEKDARAVLRALVRQPGISTERLASLAGRSRRRTDAIVARLEALEAVTVEPDGSIQLADPDHHDPGEVAAAVAQAQTRRRVLERSRVEMLRGYAETTGCRRRYLLNYLGEEYRPPCGACDRCLDREAAEPEDAAPSADGSAAPFRLNDRVRHVLHGPGLVSRVEDGRIVVAFDDAGYRTLDVEACLSGNLLRRED
jgi:ATP-dependent DNA helicase RecQ